MEGVSGGRRTPSEIEREARGSGYRDAMNHIRLEIAGGRATLTLARPPVNVLNMEMMGEMTEALASAADVSDLRVLVIRAEGKLFSAGVDVGEHLGDQARPMLDTFNGLIAAILDFPLPVVGVVQGAALGGGLEVLLACDLVLASDRAKFGQPEIKVGVYPPPAVVLLPHLVGSRRTAEIVLTGDTFTAQRAHEMGLVNRIYPADELEAGAEELIAGLAGLSGSVLRHTIQALRSSQSFRATMQPMQEHYLEGLMKTHDAMEGLNAFLEKRAPEWTHD